MLNVDLRNGLTDDPQAYGNELLGFDPEEITPGASKSLSVTTKTGYFTVYGNLAVGAPDGNPKYDKIAPSTILINNKNVYFPNYTDTISGKEAVRGVRTDWEKTGSHTWSGRKKYIKEFESKYGAQPDEYWKSVQIHHIRPRNLGGEDTFDNLMPVKTESHKLLTSWFANY